jgi:predicted DNA-binding transcriptional regulator AlpA
VQEHVEASADSSTTYRLTKLAAQTAGLDAMRAVADALGLEPGTAPTSTQFRETAPVAAPGVTISHVIRAFGRWRFARDVYEGHRPAAVQSARRLPRTQPGTTVEAAISDVQEWLASKPVSHSTTFYDVWFEKQKGDRRPGERVPLSRGGLSSLLGLTWELILAVAEDRMTLAEAQAAMPNAGSLREREPDNFGPDDLIPMRVIAEMLGGVTIASVQKRIRRQGFPPPALITARLRLWRRSDVELTLADQPVPERAPNDLQEKYLEAHEVAALFGIRRENLKRSPRVPHPVMTVSGFGFWLRDECVAAGMR